MRLGSWEAADAPWFVGGGRCALVRGRRPMRLHALWLETDNGEVVECVCRWKCRGQLLAYTASGGGQGGDPQEACMCGYGTCAFMMCLS